MKNGRRFGAPPKPYTPPESPEGRDTVTDPDSKVVKGLRGWIQGYNAQAVTNEYHIVLAAEVQTVGADFGHLEPMLDAAERKLAAAGVDETPGVLLADAGYGHGEQMQRIVDRGIPVLIPPDTSRRLGLGATGTAATTTSCAESSPASAEASSTASASDDRARLRASEVQPRPGPLQAPRPRRRPHRMASHHRHPQHSQAPPPRQLSSGDSVRRSPRRCGCVAGAVPGWWCPRGARCCGLTLRVPSYAGVELATGSLVVDVAGVPGRRRRCPTLMPVVLGVTREGRLWPRMSS
jgi:hypothetical protein